MLIEQFRPIWNLAIDGFGNKDPGKRRKDQYRSPWDVLHPGRQFAGKLDGRMNSPTPASSQIETVRALAIGLCQGAPAPCS